MKKQSKKPVPDPSIVIEIFILNKYLDNDVFTHLKKYRTMNNISQNGHLGFAKELARKLNDWQGLAYYVTVCQKYPKEIIYEVLNKVLSIPDEKIRRTRCALFNTLIQQHEQREPYDGDKDYWD